MSNFSASQIHEDGGRFIIPVGYAEDLILSRKQAEALYARIGDLLMDSDFRDLNMDTPIPFSVTAFMKEWDNAIGSVKAWVEGETPAHARDSVMGPAPF
mgnify:CR=1 FL=1